MINKPIKIDYSLKNDSDWSDTASKFEKLFNSIEGPKLPAHVSYSCSCGETFSWINFLESLGYKLTSHCGKDYTKTIWFRYGQFWVGLENQENQVKNIIFVYQNKKGLYHKIKIRYTWWIKQQELDMKIIMEALRDPLQIPLCVGIKDIGNFISTVLEDIRVIHILKK